MKEKSCLYYTPAKNTGTEQSETVTVKVKYDYSDNTIPQKQHFLKNHTEGWAKLTMCKKNTSLIAGNKKLLRLLWI